MNNILHNHSFIIFRIDSFNHVLALLLSNVDSFLNFSYLKEGTKSQVKLQFYQAPLQKHGMQLENLLEVIFS